MRAQAAALRCRAAHGQGEPGRRLAAGPSTSGWATPTPTSRPCWPTRSSSPPAPARSCSASPTRTACSATASRPAPPATASSSGTSRSPWSAAATRPSRRPSSSPASPTKVTVIHRRDELRASQDHAGAGLRQPQDRVPLEHRRSTEVLGDGQGHGLSGCATPSPARSPSSPSTGLFVAIGHEPNTALFKGQLELEDNGYVKTFDGDHPHQRGRASSPAATSRTTSTARPSPRPARGAWPPSTPSAGSRPSGGSLSRPRGREHETATGRGRCRRPGPTRRCT